MDARQRRQMSGRRDVSTISCSRSPNISAKVNPSQVHRQHHAAYHHRAMSAVAAAPSTIVEVAAKEDADANQMFTPTPAPTAIQAEKVNKHVYYVVHLGWRREARSFLYYLVTEENCFHYVSFYDLSKNRIEQRKHWGNCQKSIYKMPLAILSSPIDK